MQYFVSIENTSFFYWQMEILIESFVMHGLQDNLVIAIAENDDPKIKGYSSNLIKYGTKFMHPNFGMDAGHPPLNRAVALRTALSEGMLGFPFSVIHSDMILRKPLPEKGFQSDYGMVVNSFDETSEKTRKEIKEAIRPGLKRIAEERILKVEDLPEIPALSAPFVFNESFKSLSDVFFARLHSNTMDLIGSEGGEFPCERAAWELTLTEAFQHCSVKSEFMACPLMSNETGTNFIHYKNGIPPVFHKKFFKFSDISVRTGRCPFEVILEHNPTPNTDYVHEVIKSYNSRTGK
ncbi:hypothetical protein EBZ39_03295 [bacterium]|nr:hypothetical protein [bacterium]